MSQTTPTLPKPDKTTIQALAPPWYKSKTIGAAALAAVTGIPALISQLFSIPELQVIITPQLRPWLILVSVVATWAGMVFAKQAGVEAGARVLEIPGNSGAVDVVVTRGDLSSTPPSLLPQGPGAKLP